MNAARCLQCGMTLPSDADPCPQCGARVRRARSMDPSVSAAVRTRDRRTVVPSASAFQQSPSPGELRAMMLEKRMSTNQRWGIELLSIGPAAAFVAAALTYLVVR